MSKAGLLKASIVAALLLPFGVVAAEATPISTTSVICGYGNKPSGCGGSNTDNIFSFDGGAYSLELNFADGIPSGTGFQVTVTDSPLTDPLPPGEVCVNFTGTADGCRQFSIVPDAGARWNGGPNGIDITIAWLLDTSSTFPNGTTNQVRMIHDHINADGSVSISDITLAGSYFSAPPGCTNTGEGHKNHLDPRPGHGCDPGVTGTEDSFSPDAFSEFYVTDQVAVPEPGTMMLLGSGLVALLAVRRRARV